MSCDYLNAVDCRTLYLGEIPLQQVRLSFKQRKRI